MTAITLSQIYTYPVKSLAGIRMDEAIITPFGLQHDRRWMIVDNDSKFITQRLYPKLSLIGTRLTDNEIILTGPEKTGISIPIKLDTGNVLSATVWNDRVDVLPAAGQANNWISQFLGIECSFVYMPDSTTRQVDQGYAWTEHDKVSLADAFPFLLISEASLEDLNGRLENKGVGRVSMPRFRPNLVVSGCAAFAEDGWRSFTIGENLFHGMKLCSRCVMTTVNPEKGEKGREPLQTLFEYRKQGNHAFFGQNTLLDTGHNNTLVLNKGDRVEITELRNLWFNS